MCVTDSGLIKRRSKMNKKLILTSTLIVGLLLTGLVGFAAEEPGKGVTVKVGRATWQSAKPVEAITSLLMEKLGYEVKPPKSMTNVFAFKSIMQGDLDYFPNAWIPINMPQLPEGFRKKGSILGNIAKDAALNGFLVDKKTAEKYNIVSLTDFKRPEVRKAFDYDNNGKANLGGCPPGWGCHTAVKRMMDNYKLRDYIEVSHASYVAMIADKITMYNKGKPIFFYTWAPNFTIQRLVPGKDVVWINTPYIHPTSESQRKIVKKRGIGSMVIHNLKGAVTEYIHMGWPAGDINFAANNKFLKNNPAAKELMEQVRIPAKDINRMTLKIREGKDTRSEVLDMAATWIQNNQDKVQSWLKKARAAAE